jgi:hypothetical protein
MTWSWCDSDLINVLQRFSCGSAGGVSRRSGAYCSVVVVVRLIVVVSPRGEEV